MADGVWQALPISWSRGRVAACFRIQRLQRRTPKVQWFADRF